MTSAAKGFGLALAAIAALLLLLGLTGLIVLVALIVAVIAWHDPWSALLATPMAAFTLYAILRKGSWRWVTAALAFEVGWLMLITAVLDR